MDMSADQLLWPVWNHGHVCGPVTVTGLKPWTCLRTCCCDRFGIMDSLLQTRHCAIIMRQTDRQTHRQTHRKKERKKERKEGLEEKQKRRRSHCREPFQVWPWSSDLITILHQADTLYCSYLISKKLATSENSENKKGLLVCCLYVACFWVVPFCPADDCFDNNNNNNYNNNWLFMAPNLVVARSIYQRLQMSAFIKFTQIKSHKHMRWWWVDA